MKCRNTDNLFRAMLLIASIALFLATNVVAQSISRQVIGIAGGSTHFNNIKVSWTVGEAIVDKAVSTNGRAQATVGFQQPDLSILPPATKEQLLVNISPNPTPDVLNVTLLDPSLRNLRLTLSNTNGQVLVPSLMIEPWKNEVDLSRFPPGVYYLNVTDQERTFQTYKIIKTK